MPASVDYGGAPNPYVYQGSTIAPIRDVAEKLGAQVDYDPTTARVTVNGKAIPFDQIRDGHSYGNIHLIAAAGGGHVLTNPDGTVSVYKAPSTASPASAPGPMASQVAGFAQGAAQAASGGSAPGGAPAGGQAGGAAAAGAPAAGGTPVTGNPANPLAALAARTVQGAVAGAVTPAHAPAGAMAAAAGAVPAVNPQAAATAQPAAAAAQPQAAAGYPAYQYQEQPIDYAALQQRAQQEAAMWAAPQVQSLNDLAARYRQEADNQSGYIRQGLTDDIANLRAGEVQREQRLNEDMNRRGDAIYNSGVRFGAVRDQQIATQQQEVKLTTKATTALQKVADSLGLNMQSVAGKLQALSLQQGNRAMLTLQQLADKAQSQAFENRKFTWQMWLQGARLNLDQQTKANELWLNIQRIKSENDRAAAERQLQWAINNGQLDFKYAQLQQEADQFAQKQTLEGQKLSLQQAQLLSQQTGYIYGLDGKPITDDQGNPVRTMAGAQFDWDKQKFIISEQDKVDYQNALVDLKKQQAISDAQYQQAQLEIRKGELSISTSKLLGYMVDKDGNAMKDAAGNPIPTYDAAHPSGTNAQTGWKGVMGDLKPLLDPQYGYTQEEIDLGHGQLSHTRQAAVAAQRLEAAKAIVGRWVPYLSLTEQQQLLQYLKANGLWQ